MSRCIIAPTPIRAAVGLVVLAALVLAGETSTADAGAPPSPLFAEQLNAENIGRLRVGGSDVTGGIGDWAIGNGTLCAVIADPGHETLLSTRGGVLIDLGHCARADDEWIVLQPLVNLSRENVLPVDRLETLRDETQAAIVTHGKSGGVSIETRYILDLDLPNALRLETRVTRQPDAAGERAFLFGDVVLHGRRQLAPFTLQLEPGSGRPLAAGSVGFQHPSVDVDDTLAMVRAILPSNLQVLVGGNELMPGVSYGFQLVGAWVEDARGERRALPNLAINGESFTMLAVFTKPLWFGGSDGVGLLELAQTLFMDIDEGETLILDRRIIVGTRADVASVTDQIWPDAPLVQGRVLPAARLHFATHDGIPTTELRPDPDGSFSLRLPPGRYTLTVRAPGVRNLERTLDVTKSGLDLGLLSVDQAAVLPLPRGTPMRLIFARADGGDAPRIGDDLLGYRVGERTFDAGTQSSDVSLAGISSDPERITLPPGHYVVVATRGPEFSAHATEVVLQAGLNSRLEIATPSRVIAQPGWLAADLHVHAEHSDDSSLPLEKRLATFVAAGADVIVSTEHARVVDFHPLIARLGLGDSVQSVVGVEVTSTFLGGDTPHSFGHANVFPLPADPQAYRGGAPGGEGQRLRVLAAEVRRRGALLQLNHPRSASGGYSDQNFFTHLSVSGDAYRSELPLSAEPNRVLLERDPVTGLRDLDYDIVELMNGTSMRKYRAVRADWYSLLLQGHFRPGMANSDSHILTELVALPRTYVAMPEAGAGSFDEAAFIASIKAGRAYGTTGPILSVELRDEAGVVTGLGGLARASRGTLRIAIRAAPWVPVERARVLQDGREVWSGDVGVKPLEIPLTFSRDAFVTVEVWGEPDELYAAIAPGFQPFAFTNPIFVDADGNGRWDASGLPAQPLPILVQPEPIADD